MALTKGAGTQPAGTTPAGIGTALPLETGTFGWGAAVFPLTAPALPFGGTGGNTLLQDADPAIYWTLSYFSTVLSTYLGARWANEVALCGLPAAQQAFPAYTVPYDPAPYMRQASFSFPMLAIYRQTEDVKDLTIGWQDSVATWQVIVALPPLSAEAHERLSPMLNAAARVLTRAVWLGFDASFQGGAVVWGPGFVNAEYAAVTRVMRGNFPGLTQDLFFPSVVLTMHVAERQNPVPGAYDALTGIDTVESFATPGVADTGLLAETLKFTP